MVTPSSIHSALSCCVGGPLLSSQISPLSLWDVALQVDRQAEDRGSYLPQKCPDLDAPWWRGMSEQSSVLADEAMGQAGERSFGRDQVQS